MRSRSCSRARPVASKTSRRVSLTQAGRSGGSSVTTRVMTRYCPHSLAHCVRMPREPRKYGRRGLLEDEVAGISKSETLNRLSEKTEMPKKQVAMVLDELAALAYKEARNGFTFPGV